MGGRCTINQPDHSGMYAQFIAPQCTDNFQIVEGKFAYADFEWHSVEQAFQSLKFPIGSLAQEEIYWTNPVKGESHDEYGIRVWRMGQPRRDTDRTEDWEERKVKLMLCLCLAKYASQPSFQDDLVGTYPYRILANPSTWEWTYWNASIQMFIREQLFRGIPIDELLAEIEVQTDNEVRQQLRDANLFHSNNDTFEMFQNANVSQARALYDANPPPKTQQQESENQPIQLWEGQLILADVQDFASTYSSNMPDVVVTMCSKPPFFPTGEHNPKWWHRYFSGYDLHNFNALGSVIQDVMGALKEGKSVLVHCLEGQDRTGIVALTLVRLYHPKDLYSGLQLRLRSARPKRNHYWFGEYGMMTEGSTYNKVSKLLSLHILP